jgi:hypothetical protein
MVAIPQDGRYSGFVGFGRRKPMAELEIIPQLLWESGTLDWQRLQFTADDGAKWSGVRFIDMSDFSTDEIERLIDEGDERTPIATAALHRFLEDRVASLPAGSPFLAEQHLLIDAKQASPRNNITRITGSEIVCRQIRKSLHIGQNDSAQTTGFQVKSPEN